MSVKEFEEYEFIKTDFLNKCFDDMSGIDFFALTQLLQSHYCTAVEKRLELNRLIDNIDDKVIIFVKYLNSIPDGALKVIGEMNTEQRTKAIQRFKNSEKVLYITYGCGAYGLNLQFCKNIIFAEHSFDYAQREQAEAMIYRMGQKYNVDYYNLWCNVGLERLIQGSLNKKSNLLDEVKKEIADRGVKEWVKDI